MEIAFKIEYVEVVMQNDIPSLGNNVRERIKNAVETKLMLAPDVFGIPLRRALKGYRKLRVGDYRIIFRIVKTTVLIIAIMHRSTVYERISARIK